MTISKPWGFYIEALRSEIQSARPTNWQRLQNNTTAHLENARFYVRAATEIDRAIDFAKQQCNAFVQDIADRGPLYSQDDPASRQARELALLAIADLEQQLQDARPSDEAVKLGLGW